MTERLLLAPCLVAAILFSCVAILMSQGLIVGNATLGTFGAVVVADGAAHGDDMSLTAGALGAPEVTSIAANNVSGTLAILSGELRSLGDASSVTVSFVYGTDTGGPYPEETTGEVRTSAGYFGARLSGLTPGTTYYFRAKAAGSDTSYGVEMNFTTASTATPPSVTTNVVTHLTTTSAYLNMYLTDLGTVDSVSVCFDWGITTSYGNTTTPTTRFSLGPVGCALTGLTPDTTYYYRAVAVGDGTAYGDDMSFTTTLTAPSVVTGGATEITIDSATLKGGLLASGGADWVSVSFQYGSVPGSYTKETAAKFATSTGAFNAHISGLDPGTVYYYRAKAVGYGTAYGDEMSFTTATLVSPPGSNCWAVIVGVADYEYASDLRYTDDDARALYEVLFPLWGEDHVKVLLNSQATRANIESVISGWLDPMEDADDTVLVFFSGHGGYADHDEAPLDEDDGRDEYIVPYDAGVMILDDELNSWLSGLESARQAVIIDSCYSGGFIGSDFALDLSKSDRVVLTATQEDEVGWETSDLGHSVFLYYLLDGLEHLDVLDSDGNDEVSAEELFRYVQPRTTEYESTHDLESVQHPQIYDGYEGDLGLFTLATLTIDADERVTSVALDGQSYSASDLPVAVNFLPGRNHAFTFSVALTIDSEAEQAKHTFLSWEDGVTSVTRTVNISESTSYVAEYSTQYYLDVESDSGNPESEGWYDSGTEVSLSADEASDVSSGMRQIFLTWTVDGESVSGNPITVKMDSAHVVTALHTSQYQLTVLSDRGETQGSGWYEAGSEASISVRSTSGVMVRRVFDGWSGDSSAKDENATVMMDGPKTVEALWRTDYTQLYILLAGILLFALVAVAVIVLVTRSQRHARPQMGQPGANE